MGEIAGTVATNLNDYTELDRVQGRQRDRRVVVPTGATSGPLDVSVDSNDDIVCTITNSRDTGSLKVTKSFNAGNSGFNGTFDIDVNCDIDSFDQTVTLPAGSSQTISDIPTGTKCVVSEPTLPTAPTDWTFGTPSFSPVGANTTGVTIPTGAGSSVEVTVTNTITHDQGYLKIKKVFDAKTSGFSSSFSIKYNCGAGDLTVTLVAGATSAAIGPFDTGTVCVVTEPTLPTAPTGWTFGTPSFSPSGANTTGVTITKGDSTQAVLVTVTNTITRDTGSFKITKVLNVGGSGFNTNTLFTINYTCKIGTTTTASGSLQLKGGQSATVSDIPTGSICTVTEPTQPTAPTGYSWWVTISPSSVTITKDANPIPEVTVTNSLRRTALTPGYWKNHLDVAFSLPGGPSVTLGTFAVSSKQIATKVFNAMNCSSSKPNDAIGCLAGHLLATEYNLLNGTDTCIVAVRDKADAFLSGGIADGVTGITYAGPTGSYTLSAAQRAEAIKLKDAMDKYNNNGGC